MRINSGYGGSKREMHPTNIQKEVVYLGPHEKNIDLGNEKHVLLQEGGNVPFWMTP